MLLSLTALRSSNLAQESLKWMHFLTGIQEVNMWGPCFVAVLIRCLPVPALLLRDEPEPGWEQKRLKWL